MSAMTVTPTAFDEIPVVFDDAPHTKRGVVREHRWSATTAGVLYIIGTVAGFISLSLTAPVRDAADPLASASAHEGTMVSAAVVVLVMGFALALIPVVLFPILRKVNEALAAGYLVIRGAVETTCYVLIAVSYLAVASLSGVTPGADGAGSWLAETLAKAEAPNAVLALVFCLGAAFFNVALYISGIVPRWISVWGLIAIPFYVTAALLGAYGAVAVGSAGLMLLFMPMAIQEMVLAVWMILRGFRPTLRR
jgi:hypothetical protein